MQTITMRELRDMFAPEAEADTVRVEVPELHPITFARVETAPRTSVAVER